MNILLIDDDTSVRSALARALKMRGDHVVDISIPTEALEFLATAGLAEDFDLVITDYQMPRMNGLEVARQVRRLYQLPVIIISGDVALFERDLSKQEAAEISVLRKPFTMIEMAAAQLKTTRDKRGRGKKKAAK